MKHVHERSVRVDKREKNTMVKKVISEGQAQQSLRDKIVSETEAFLASGKKIQEIPNGVSGQSTQSGSRHIRISTKKD